MTSTGNHNAIQRLAGVMDQFATRFGVGRCMPTDCCEFSFQRLDDLKARLRVPTLEEDEGAKLQVRVERLKQTLSSGNHVYVCVLI